MALKIDFGGHRHLAIFKCLHWRNEVSPIFFWGNNYHESLKLLLLFLARSDSYNSIRFPILPKI